MKAFKDLRKRLLINRDFQVSYLKYTCGIAFVIFTIFFLADRLFLWKYTQKGIEAGLPHDHLFFRIMAEQQDLMSIFFVVTALIVFAFLIGYGLYLSNRIAGPIHRLEKSLKKYLAGNGSGDLKFRVGDYFHELEAPINELIRRDSK